MALYAKVKTRRPVIRSICGTLIDVTPRESPTTMTPASTPPRSNRAKRKPLRASGCRSRNDAARSPINTIRSIARSHSAAVRICAMSELEVDEAVAGERAEQEDDPDRRGDEGETGHRRVQARPERRRQPRGRR